MEDELDSILSQLDCQQLLSLDANFDPRPIDPTYSRALEPHLPSSGTIQPRLVTEGENSLPRFDFKSDEEVRQVQKSAVPKNTERNTTWAVNIWKAWSAQRRQAYASYSDWPVHPIITVETRKSNGKPYPPNTLYAICCGLMRYVREQRPTINFFADPEFASFRKTLDGEMKRLRSLGLGVKKKQAEPITVDDETLLWDKGQLGDHSPQTLLDTMIYLIGIHFALRSGQEHRDLQTTQFEVVNPTDAEPYLIYTENVSKNNPGGLSHRKITPKRVVHHSNSANPNRCLVKLFEKYMSHRPLGKITTAFYLKALKKPQGNVWYTQTPVGHNTLAKTVQRLCTAAGIPGYKTNHSLRVTAATRLFNSGVDEQLIMSRTGHRSIEGVRTYKRVSEEQAKAVSEVLNTATNGQSIYTHEIHNLTSKKIKLDESSNDSSVTAFIAASSSSSSSSVITPSTSSSVPPTFNFTGCSSVTINFCTKN